MNFSQARTSTEPARLHYCGWARAPYEGIPRLAGLVESEAPRRNESPGALGSKLPKEDCKIARSIGLDLHSASLYTTTIDPQEGTVARFELPVEEADIQAFEAQLRPDDRIAIEATTNCHYFYHRLSPLVAEVVIANPIKLRPWLGQEDKSDRNDSYMLALLNGFGCLPTVWMPDEETEQDRRLLSRRTDLVQEQTRCLNRIRSLLARHALICPASDLRTQAARDLVRRLRSRLPAGEQLLLDSLLTQLDGLQALLEPIEALAAVHAAKRSEVELLSTVTGLDQLLSLTILAAIGTVTRFPRPGSAVKYAGLCPRENSSGGKAKRGSIRKAGSRQLRWALTQAAKNLVKRPGRFRNLYRRLKRKGEGLALTACARKLMVVIWHMLTTGEAYRELDPKLAKRKRARVKQRLKKARRVLSERPSPWQNLLDHAPLLKQLCGGKVGFPLSLRPASRKGHHPKLVSTG